ncbi:MAG TPA: glycosyltransferase family 4 protein [Verrucomicrobiae bacterium]|nr:glycosyltransferase family 4 protein [Verrucomicrobiae bacterium]
MGVVFIAPVIPLDVAMMAAALERAGWLDRLVTRWCFTGSGWARARRFRCPERWLRRPQAPVGREHLLRVPLADVRQKGAAWFGGGQIKALDKSFARVDQAGAKLVTGQTGAVLAREDSCIESFHQAAEWGRPRLYQLPSAHCATVERLIRREAVEFPEAFDRGEMEAEFAPARLQRKSEELDLATWVLCPSNFAANSVRAAGAAAERICTLPLGSDTRWSPVATVERGPVFLCVGKVCARKGIHRVLRVWKKLGAWRTHRLRLIGELGLPHRFLAEFSGCFEHVARVAREALPIEYSRAQALVFNPVADGFGHVFAEAMACGAPVLASRNCGAPDLVTDGVEGRLFDYGDDEQLGATLDWALTHPRELGLMGAGARRRALTWGWEQFSRGFLEWLEPLINLGR